MKNLNVLEYKKVKVKESECDLIVCLDSITDNLYALSSKLDKKASILSEDTILDLGKRIENLIDKVDETNLDECVNPICKRAIQEGLSKEEFEEGFTAFCENNDITNPESLISCALEIFDYALS